MTEMRRRFLRRRQAYLAWLLTDLVLVAWRRYAAGERRLRHNVTAADITAVLPDISVEDNQKLAQAAMQLAAGLSTRGAAGGEWAGVPEDGAAVVCEVCGGADHGGEIAQMIQEGHEGQAKDSDR